MQVEGMGRALAWGQAWQGTLARCEARVPRQSWMRTRYGGAAPNPEPLQPYHAVNTRINLSISAIPLCTEGEIRIRSLYNVT